MIPYRLNPLGITVNENLPLTLTAEQANSTVKLTATGSPTVSGLHYRLGKSGEWLAYTIGNTITLANIGDSVQFWNSADTLSNSASNYVQFVMTGIVNASGTVQSLLNFSDICPTFSFFRLFRDCVSMTSAPKLSAAILGTYSYYGTFYGCTSLTEIILPAKNLSNYCYYGIVQRCTNVSTVRVYFTAWDPSNATTSWLGSVAASGTFIKPAALPEEYGTDRIPSGWTVVNK